MQTTKSHTHHLDPGDHRQCFWVTMTNRGCSGVRVPWQHGHVRFPQPDMRDQLAHLPPKCASVSLLSAAAGSLASALAPWPALFLLPRTWTHSWTPSPVSAHTVLLQSALPLPWVCLQLWRNVTERLRRASLGFEGCILWL